MSSDRVTGVGLLVRGVSSTGCPGADWLGLGADCCWTGEDCYRTGEDDQGTLGLSENSGTRTRAPTKGVLGFNTVVYGVFKRNQIFYKKLKIASFNHGVIGQIGSWGGLAGPTPNQKPNFPLTPPILGSMIICLTAKDNIWINSVLNHTIILGNIWKIEGECEIRWMVSSNLLIGWSICIFLTMHKFVHKFPSTYEIQICP